jgi:hypothetical protein
MYRKAAGFCDLIMYPPTLLKLFMVPRSFLVKFSKSFQYKMISSANRDSLTSSFPICTLLFLHPNLLLCQKILRPCWVRMERVDTLFSFLTLVIIAPITLRYIHSSPSFIIFIMKGCWIFPRLFLYLLRWSSDFCLCFC